jgi:serine-protein kinase ATM
VTRLYFRACTLTTLVHPRRSWGRSKSTRDSFHALIEALFSYARLEKASYVKNTKPTMKTKLTSRLSLCALGLRNAVQVAGHKFKTKMVTAVIHHIMETLPTTREGYCEPLCEDYLKTLTIILGIPHHVEHLSGEEWLELIDFCLQGISSVEQDSQRSDHNGYRHSPSLTEANSGRNTPSRSIKAVTIRSSKPMGKISVDDLMLCLEYLTAAPNCPLLTVTHRLFDEVTGALRSSSPTNKSNQSTFAVLNSALLRSLTEKPTLSRSLALNIVPIIRRFWEKSSKSPLLRDEMLITLTLVRKTYPALMSSDDRAEFEDVLESLLETLQSEYSKLFERDQIQLEDITFSLFNANNSLNVSDMHMSLASPKAEHNWTLLQTITDLVVVIETKMSSESVESEPDSDGPPKKKLRLLRRTEELLRVACSEEPSRVSSLQMLCFLFTRQTLDLETLTSALDGLYGILLEESTLAVSWAMLTITSCSRQKVGRHPSLKLRWLKIWQLASRCAANLGTSRCASHLMHEILHGEILQYMDCIETFNTIISPAGLLSPPTLSDSTLLLWTKIMIMRSSVNPSVSASTLTRIVTWLRVTWAPEALQDRSFASQMAAHARPMDILYLLLTATGRSSKFPKLLNGPASGAISRACLRDRRNHDLVEYLLMTEAANPKIQKESESEISDGIEALQIKEESDQLVLDLLQSKVDSFAEAWSSMIKTGNSRSSLDAAKIVCSLCIIANAFVACIGRKESKRTKTLRMKCDQLWEQTCKSFLPEPDKLDECLDIIGSCLPSKMEPDARIGFVLDGISRMAPKFVNLLSQRNVANLNTSSTEDMNLMEVDDSFTSNHSQPAQDTVTSSFIRYQLPVPGDIKSYRILVTARLYVLCSVPHLQASEDTVPMSPVEYLLSLEIPDLIACAKVVLEALLYQPEIDRDHANEVLEYIGTEVIGGYEFERCEAALCASVSVLEGLADSWVNDKGDELCDSASQVYSWFINVASEQSIMSSRVHIGLAKLLQKILTIDSEYSPEDSVPSPRTSLFKLLCDGDLLVKFEIGKNFSKIFGQFILKEHEVIFEDVLESLPADSECIEGLCLRLFVLAELASKWHTLLRRCVYHIFETAGQVPASAIHAKYCLSMVSDSLGLESAQGLFKLFVSQLLYTWLKTQSLRSIPYSIFGYTSLKALLSDIQDDITGQVMMRANDDEAQELSDCLEVPFDELLAISFPKVEAYSVARDITTPRSQDSQPIGGEARVRKRLGTEAFAQLVQIHFPSTLAVLFQTMDQDEQIEKAFVKRPDYRVARDTLRDIRQISFSEAVLPVNQQPSFRAKYILDELEFLCRRAKYDLHALWTPALFVFIGRRLLDSIHPALGSLHACSVVRKLRILVSLAGETALQDYPLEMMLHALRPMVTNFHSSDDALGLFQYLLDRGRSYLSSNPSFMASIALSTLTSLKVFLNSPQDSTTQESEYNATLSRAQTFHAWLCKFLEEYNSSNMPEGIEGAFKEMVAAAQRARSMGNAIKGTYESALLQELLRDKEAIKPLLSVPAWNSVFDLLSTDFQRPPKVQDDILGESEAAKTYSKAVWGSVQRSHLGIGYLSWAGRVLGRAYASNGNIRFLKRQEHGVDLLVNNDTSAYAQSDSKAEILLSLCEVLFGSSGTETGVVEGTLQSIAARLGDERMFRDYEKILPPSLMKTLFWTPYYSPDTGLESSEDHVSYESTSWNPHLPVSEWVQSMALAISVSNASDPILGALHQILTRSTDLALRLFPFILHRALLLEYDGRRSTREKYSSIFLECFRDREGPTIPHTRAILSALLYLRNQPLPHESTIADRENWLELDYADAAAAALYCQMYKTAILFIEIQASRASRSSRRSSVAKFKEPTELLFNIFRSIDDPDSFYGVHKQPSLHSVIEEMEYEGTGLRNTSFQSASFDSGIRRGAPEQSATLGLVHSLNSANLKGLARALLSDTDIRNNMSDNYTNMFQTALALQQWDLPTPKSINSDSANTFRAFQSLNLMENESGIRDTINDSISSVMKNMVTGINTNHSLHSALGTLASLTQVDQLLSCQSSSELEDEWSKMIPRSSWMDTAK